MSGSCADTQTVVTKSSAAVQAVLAQSDPSMPSAAVLAASMACMCALCEDTMPNVPKEAQSAAYYTALANDPKFEAMASKMIGKAFDKVEAMAAGQRAPTDGHAMGQKMETLRTARAAKALMTSTFATMMVVGTGDRCGTSAPVGGNLGGHPGTALARPTTPRRVTPSASIVEAIFARRKRNA